ncbi:MAG: LysM peptidoglycan-binding domain-containing protein [Anaerolineaceae bacterium]
MPEEKKNIFQKIGNAFSNKDKKEEATKKAANEVAKAEEAAKTKAEELSKKAEGEAHQAESEAKWIAEENKERVEQAERYKAEAEARQAESEAKKREAEEAKKNAIIAEHTVTSDDTLSHIALQYYGHATPAYYKLIYEFNKDIIGNNMNVIKPGQVLRIPVLPDELK